MGVVCSSPGFRDCLPGVELHGLQSVQVADGPAFPATAQRLHVVIYIYIYMYIWYIHGPQLKGLP